jgi:hypothetical protein
VAERKIGTKMLGFQPANFGGANVFDSDKVHLSVSDYADNTAHARYRSAPRRPSAAISTSPPPRVPSR